MIEKTLKKPSYLELLFVKYIRSVHIMYKITILNIQLTQNNYSWLKKFRPLKKVEKHNNTIMVHSNWIRDNNISINKVVQVSLAIRGGLRFREILNPRIQKLPIYAYWKIKIVVSPSLFMVFPCFLASE